MKYTPKHRLQLSRRYAQIFSRGVYADILRWGDSDLLNKICIQNGINEDETYLDCIHRFYNSLKRYYRCEYVFKNEILNALKKRYSKSGALVLNEFRVNKSIVDIALFNGESCAYEIKTSYDSPRRFTSQMNDYRTLFDKCYLVVEKSEVDDWLVVNDDIGIMAFCCGPKGGISFEEIRQAKLNESLSVESLLSCMRVKEYEAIAEEYGQCVLSTPSYLHYSECKSLLEKIDKKTLRQAFLKTIERRKSSFSLLEKVPRELYQICISMQLSDNQVRIINNMLNNKVSF